MTFDDGKQRERITDEQRLKERRGVKTNSKQLLYFNPIICAQEGSYQIDVLAANDALIASVTVRSVKKNAPIWERLDSERNPQTDAIHIRSPGNAPALPDYDDTNPIPAPAADAKRDAQKSLNERLPQFLPTTPDPSLTLKIEGQNLIKTSTTDILTSSYLGEYSFLVRWWVNGKPVERASDDIHIRCGNYQRQMGKTVTLRLDGDTSKIGAKKGDKIGIQLIYWDRGFVRPSQSNPREEKVQQQPATHLPRLSNRVDFIAR